MAYWPVSFLMVSHLVFVIVFYYVSRLAPHAKTARLLTLMVIPGSLIFLCVIAALNGGHTSLTLMFVTFYQLAAVLQVIKLVHR